MSWDLIVWKSDDAIDFVPSIWSNAEGTAYKYPSGMSESRRREYIYDCKDLDSFLWCEAGRKKCNITNIQRAKALCRRGQETSHLETSSGSEDDNNANERRKRKPTKRYVSISSSGTDDDDEPQKKVSKNTTQSQVGRAREKKTFTVPRLDEALSGSTRLATTITGNSGTSSKVTSSRTQCSAIDNNSSSVTLGGSDLESINSSRDGYAVISFQLKEIIRRLNNIENRLLLSERNQPSILGEKPDLFNLPCNTVDELNTLNDSLKDPEKMNGLVQMLFLLGGEDPHKTLFQMLHKVIGKNLATQYSGIGKKKKLPFMALSQIIEAITVALRKRFSTVMELDIKKSIALFLASAKSRLPKPHQDQ